MKKIFIGIIMLLCFSQAYARDGAILQDQNGNAITAANPLPIQIVGGGASQWDDVSAGINYAGGNVGINTVSPAYSLEVNGNVGIDLTLYGGGASFVNDVVIQNARSLSIGTTAGTARLEVGAGTQSHVEGSNDAHFGGSIEVDLGVYVDGAIYSSGTTIFIKQPDGGCSGCGVDNAGTTWSCVNSTCPASM